MRVDAPEEGVRKMSESQEWTLEVRPHGDDAKLREITLRQLRTELSAGTIAASDEVRSPFALDGHWRAASDIEALASSLKAPKPSLPPHLPFALASMVLSFAYAAILGANALPTLPGKSIGLLIPIVGIGVMALLLAKPPAAFHDRVRRWWAVIAIVALGIALAIGAAVDAYVVGTAFVASTAVSLVLGGYAAVLVERKQSDQVWRALCAFAIPLGMLTGAVTRVLPTWFSSTAEVSNVGGLFGFIGATLALPILVIVRLKRAQ